MKGEISNSFIIIVHRTYSFVLWRACRREEEEEAFFLFFLVVRLWVYILSCGVFYNISYIPVTRPNYCQKKKKKRKDIS